MIKDAKISNEEITLLKTEGGNFSVSEKTTSETPEDNVAPASYDVASKNLTPTEVVQIRRHEMEIKKNESMKNLYDMLRICAKWLSVLLGIVITLGAGFLIYFITSIAEPIGGLKEKVENIEKLNNDLIGRFEKLENKLIETREEFIKSNIKK